MQVKETKAGHSFAWRKGSYMHTIRSRERGRRRHGHCPCKRTPWRLVVGCLTVDMSVPRAQCPMMSHLMMWRERLHTSSSSRKSLISSPMVVWAVLSEDTRTQTRLYRIGTCVALIQLWLGGMTLTFTLASFDFPYPVLRFANTCKYLQFTQFQ
jgi:hypothetical protein